MERPQRLQVLLCDDSYEDEINTHHIIQYEVLSETGTRLFVYSQNLNTTVEYALKHDKEHIQQTTTWVVDQCFAKIKEACRITSSVTGQNIQPNVQFIKMDGTIIEPSPIRRPSYTEV
jgi:hypothetical protein